LPAISPSCRSCCRSLDRQRSRAGCFSQQSRRPMRKTDGFAFVPPTCRYGRHAGRRTCSGSDQKVSSPSRRFRDRGMNFSRHSTSSRGFCNENAQPSCSMMRRGGLRRISPSCRGYCGSLETGCGLVRKNQGGSCRPVKVLTRMIRFQHSSPTHEYTACPMPQSGSDLPPMTLPLPSAGAQHSPDTEAS